VDFMADKRPVDDADGPKVPQKKFFRSRAHSNVLNNNDLWFPATPQDVPLGTYFPHRSGQKIRFVDVGSGFGSLCLSLARTFPQELTLGIEIRPKLVEYAQKRVIALRHEASTSEPAASAASTPVDPQPTYDNVWSIHHNAMRFMPNFFDQGQLQKLFICFPDPHFKRKNHRKRIISHPLLAEFGYTLAPGGILYIVTDVSELMEWMVGRLTESPLFDRMPREALKVDAAVPLLIHTDEGSKVQRNNGNMFIAAFRKRDDPTAAREAPVLLGNDEAAAAALDAGYTPKAGGELRGRSW
jgi:tRNA (guanine-N7-)-methyltransferase